MRSAGNVKSKALLPSFLPLRKMRFANRRRQAACRARPACVLNEHRMRRAQRLRRIPRYRKTGDKKGAIMELKFSKVARKGPITIVTLSRPEVYNALHIDAHFELNKVFDDFSADPEQWVAIVTGSGDKAFCAGNDLKWQAAGGKRGWDKGGFAGLTTRFDCDKPIIAAVNGVAMGGGFEIALACDLIIASENATFALPEPRVGLAALAGGLQRLPRQIGLKRAMGMILTARHVSAREGFELGFVNEVVGAGEALAAAERWAETIAKNSPMSIRASKQAIRMGMEVSLEKAMTDQRDYPAVKAMAASQDYIEGPKAFAQKRPPKWLGR